MGRKAGLRGEPFIGVETATPHASPCVHTTRGRVEQKPLTCAIVLPSSSSSDPLLDLAADLAALAALGAAAVTLGVADFLAGADEGGRGRKRKNGACRWVR